MSALERTETHVMAADGWRLGVQHLRTAGPVKGAALLLHAMFVDRRTMDRKEDGLASHLARRGWHVVNADFRGRGASGPSPRDGGRWCYDDLVRFDVPALAAATRSRADGGPVWLIGQSLGGHVGIASMGVAGADVDGWIGLSANMWLPSLEPSFAARRVKGAVMKSLASTASIIGRIPARRLGLGTCDEAGAYARDLAGFWHRGAWSRRDGTGDYAAAARTLTVPRLSVHGLGDAWLGRLPAASRWARDLGAEVWLVGDGAFGVDGRPGHMALTTSPTCRPLWSAIEAWMTDRAGERA